MTGDAADWAWDETLYAGAASYYPAGRMPYPDALAQAIRSEVELDGTGRLLDVGCGPGSLTLLLAPLVAAATGVNGSTEMIATARERASRSGSKNTDWLVLRAEDISRALGTFRVVTFAQSFHWINRPLVARLVQQVLEPDGACMIVYAMTHAGTEGTAPLAHPRPPRAQIDGLIRAYLGSTRLAGRGTRPARERPGDHTPLSDEEVLAQAGFRGPVSREIAAGPAVERDEDEVVASVFSLSYATPRHFGSRQQEFERDLRALLRRTAADGRFCEQPREITIQVWRPAP
jgi:SAM-dependent methyltransferase